MGIKENILTEENSFLAKQKGFNEPCFSRYIKFNPDADYSKMELEDFVLESDGQDNGDYIDIKDWNTDNKGNKTNENICSAPLHEQIINWLESEHEIFINIIYEPHWKQFRYKIYNKPEGKGSDGYIGMRDTFYLKRLCMENSIHEALKLVV